MISAWLIVFFVTVAWVAAAGVGVGATFDSSSGLVSWDYWVT